MAAYNDPIDVAAEWLCGDGAQSTECLIAGFGQLPAATLFAWIAVFLIETPPAVLASSAPFQRVKRWPWFLTLTCSAMLLFVSVASIVATAQDDTRQRGEFLAACVTTAAWALHTVAMVRRWARRGPIGDYVLAWWLLVFAFDAASASMTFITIRRDGLTIAWPDAAAPILAFARIVAIAPLAGLAGTALCLTDPAPTGKHGAANEGTEAPLLATAEKEAAAERGEEPSIGPYDRAGLLSRILFLYINPLIRAGYAHPLEKTDLPALSWDDRAPQVESRFQAAWDAAAAAAEAKAEKAAAAAEAKARRRIGGSSRGRAKARDGEKRSLLGTAAATDAAAESISSSSMAMRKRPLAQPKLVGVLVSAFGQMFLHAALFKLTFDVVQFAGPLLLDGIVTYLNDAAEGRSPPLWIGFAYTAVLLGSSLLQTALLHQYFHRAFRVGQHVRSGLILAIYNKTLRLSLASRAGAASSTGTITNLMSTDAKRLGDLISCA